MFPSLLTADATFNACWTHLRQPQRSAAEDRLMLTLAHTSRALWEGQGGAREAALGDWQISRCYAVLGHGALAVSFAQSALHLAETTPLDAFMVATAHEAMARALTDLLEDPEDREVMLADLAGHL